MSEYEMLKAALDFIKGKLMYNEFECHMSIHHDLNDEELEEELSLMHNFNE